MTISEAFTAYTQDVIVFRNQSRKTEENHYVAMRALLVFFDDVQIHTLNFQMVRLWKQALERTRSPETVRNYIIRLRVVLGYLEKRGEPVLSPEQIPVPQRVDKVPICLTKEQVAECINATKKIKNKCIVSLLYASGVRISELCSLDRGSITDIHFTVIGKGGRARLCFIDERTKTLLQLYLESRTDNHKALFLTEAGLRISPGTVQDTFRWIRRKTGLECHPHTMRHSFATNLLQTNTNLFYVQRLLGHQSLQTTQQYLHVFDADLQQIYRKHHTT